MRACSVLIFEYAWMRDLIHVRKCLYASIFLCDMDAKYVLFTRPQLLMPRKCPQRLVKRKVPTCSTRLHSNGLDRHGVMKSNHVSDMSEVDSRVGLQPVGNPGRLEPVSRSTVPDNNPATRTKERKGYE